MRTLIDSQLPSQSEKTAAVLLYSEENLMVDSAAKTHTMVRRAYKILRSSGRDYGMVVVHLNSFRKLNSLRGWSIPAQGKPYHVKEKDSLETYIPEVQDSELINDTKQRVLRIPASDPGNVIGYEYEVEEQSLASQDQWMFQTEVPARESQYSIQLPEGWEYRATWLNHREVEPVQLGNSRWQWTLNDVKEIPQEPDMPPIEAVAGRMIVSFFPKAETQKFSKWQQVGDWFLSLAQGRNDSSPEIRSQVNTLVTASHQRLGKMQALAQFIQHDMRYVAIELGLGGFQPHSARETFSHRYGDCKDLATLFQVMLREIGVESFYVLINTQRGVITPETPPNLWFNHVVLAIRLPEDFADPFLVATMHHSRLGRLLFFDPTDYLTPLGQIRGDLQANYGLLVIPDGENLTLLPQQATELNGVRRTGRLKIDLSGNLQGEVEELRLGDHATSQRSILRTVNTYAGRTKTIEQTLSSAFANFRITNAAIMNLETTDQPLGFKYSFESANYAKRAGNLVLLRPRVLGSEARTLLETKEARRYAIEFSGPRLDTDTFDIGLPPGLQVEELPPATLIDYDFASYSSSTELHGEMIRYTRRFELKELSVPANRADELKKFYRVIAADERNTVVLRPTN
ncbi:MAG TPA: DUF3857 and transglutaminase domain-containing protein [Terriglobales bacterium]|nr:DUF3857 and transglutaminase domain-containing protein [Terriglobales bacterium]